MALEGEAPLHGRATARPYMPIPGAVGTPDGASAGDSRPFDILIPGDYFCDIVFTGLPRFPSLGVELYADALDVVPGGGALNTSIGLRRLHVEVGWLGRLGSDFFSQFIENLLRAENVDTSLIQRLDEPLRRVTVALSFPQDRAFVTYVDAEPEPVDQVLAVFERVEFRHLHFPGLTIDPRLPALIEACHTRGIRVSMDCQHRDQTLTDPLVRDIICRLDVFMPNASEAMRLTQTEDIDQAVSILSALVPCLVIKQGAAGAWARQHAIDYRRPALPVEVVDTTGAGDAFNAGFLAAYVQGLDPDECLRWGTFCGSQSVRGLGGTRTAPTYEALHAWLASPRN